MRFDRPHVVFSKNNSYRDGKLYHQGSCSASTKLRCQLGTATIAFAKCAGAGTAAAGGGGVPAALQRRVRRSRARAALLVQGGLPDERVLHDAAELAERADAAAGGRPPLAAAAADCKLVGARRVQLRAGVGAERTRVGA